MDRDAEVATVVYRLAPAFRGRPINAIEYLPGGYSNRNYRVEIDGDRYALRLVDRGPARRHERRYLDLALAPNVVAHDEHRGHLLTTWITGAVLAAAPPTPAEAGAYLANLHRGIPTGIHRYDYAAEVTALLRRAGTVDAAVVKYFQRLAWSPARLHGCHNDLNPWNIIRATDAGGGLRTLDWESAGDNDPLFDLAGLCLGLGWGAAETAACLTACRASGSPIRAAPERLHATRRAFQIREYAWAMAQLAAGNDRDEIRAQAETMRRAVLSDPAPGRPGRRR